MNPFRKLMLRAAPGILVLLLAGNSMAQNAAVQANNPLAETRAFDVHAYLISDLSESDGSASQFIGRYALPFSLGSSRWLMRASLPVNDFPVGPAGSNRSGPGDIDIFAAYLFETGDRAVSFGIGPQLVMPTASPDELGRDQWQLGLTNIYFNARSAKFQYGYLAAYRTGLGSSNGRERVSLLALQPFAFFQLGRGWYTGTSPSWSYDFNSDDYTVPVGIRLGKVFRVGAAVVNIFAEPQIAVVDDGRGLPERQIFLGVNTQF